MLVDKLMTLTDGKACQGVKDYTEAEVLTKGSKFTVPALKNSSMMASRATVGPMMSTSTDSSRS